MHPGYERGDRCLARLVSFEIGESATHLEKDVQKRCLTFCLRVDEENSRKIRDEFRRRGGGGSNLNTFEQADNIDFFVFQRNRG